MNLHFSNFCAVVRTNQRSTFHYLLNIYKLRLVLLLQVPSENVKSKINTSTNIYPQILIEINMLVIAWVILGGYAHDYKFVACANCLSSSYAFTPSKNLYIFNGLTLLYRYAHSYTNTLQYTTHTYTYIHWEQNI